jgi:hypothetical protein
VRADALGLQAFGGGFLDEVHGRADRQVLERGMHHVFTREVQLAPVLRGDEADALRGVEARDAPGELGRMTLDVAALPARVVFEPAARGVEGVAQRHLHVLVVLLGDDDLAAGNLEVDARRELLAVALVAAAELQHHPAAHDVVVVAVELLRALPDGVVQGVGVLDAVQRDLEGDFHAPEPSARPGRGFDLGQGASARARATARA